MNAMLKGIRVNFCNMKLLHAFLCIALFLCSSLFPVGAVNHPNKNLTIKKALDFFISDFKKSKHTVNHNNHEFIVANIICPHLDSLKIIEDTAFISSNQRFEFLKEVVLLYDKILDISDKDPLILSCIYNYYDSSQAEELIEMTHQFLSPNKQKSFFDLLKIFERGELEGNGDNLKDLEAVLYNLLLNVNYEMTPSNTNYIHADNNLNIEAFYESFIGPPAVHLSDVVNYFVDTLVKNATCYCQGNNGCTRGCRPSSELASGQSSSVRKCVGKKDLSKTKARCARHVNSAITNTIEAFFSPYCMKLAPHIKGYQQCIEDFTTDVSTRNINTCQHAFIFPSALCMLNLSGNNFSAYDNSISNKRVREACKSWDLYNQNLYTLSIPYFDKSASLFKKVSADKYEEYGKNPSKIPVGSIIVSKSQSRHGHVEVRTDKMLCGRDKKQICFCSDYCRERDSYRWPYKILAVYEWNSHNF